MGIVGRAHVPFETDQEAEHEALEFHDPNGLLALQRRIESGERAFIVGPPAERGGQSSIPMRYQAAP